MKKYDAEYTLIQRNQQDPIQEEWIPNQRWSIAPLKYLHGKEVDLKQLNYLHVNLVPKI